MSEEGSVGGGAEEQLLDPEAGGSGLQEHQHRPQEGSAGLQLQKEQEGRHQQVANSSDQTGFEEDSSRRRVRGFW